MALYQGFLGSEATRFPGQDTVDIHLTHWRNHPVRPLRQRTIALTQGMSFISIEQMLPFANPAGGPPVWSWVPSLTFTVAVQLWCIGPSQPALPGLPLVSQTTLWLLVRNSTLSIAQSGSISHAAGGGLVEWSMALRVLSALGL